jgi:hypothetical protein
LEKPRPERFAVDWHRSAGAASPHCPPTDDEFLILIQEEKRGRAWAEPERLGSELLSDQG